MWVITHVLAGLAVAALMGGPWWLVAAVVLAAHVLMDLVPHWDYTVSRHPVGYGVADFAASLAAWLLAWLVLGMPFWMAFMGPLSGAPDWDVLINSLRRGEPRKWFPSHWKRFPHGRSAPAFGIGVQALLMAASVAVVLWRAPW